MSRTDVQVVLYWMMLGKVVSMVLLCCSPKEVKVLQLAFLSEPIVPHIPQFRSLLCDIIVDEVVSGGIVCLDRGGRLGVPECM